MLDTRVFKTDPDNVPPEGVKKYRALFVALQIIGGQLGLPLFIGTMLLARSVKRHLILVNFCLSWVIYSLAFCLTIIANQGVETGVGARLCIAQAALVHGVVPLAVTTYCALHIQIWIGLQAAFNEDSWVLRHRRQLLVFMLYSPYAVFFAFCMGSLAVCLQHPNLVDRTGTYYCTINYDPLVLAIPGYAAVIIAFMLILEIVIAVTIIRRWHMIRRSETVSKASLSMIVRICIFSVYGIITLIACVAFLAQSLTILPYVIMSSLPTAIFLTFGTRGDVWRVWCFWKDRDGFGALTEKSQTLDSQISIEEGEVSPDRPPRPIEKD